MVKLRKRTLNYEIKKNKDNAEKIETAFKAYERLMREKFNSFIYRESIRSTHKLQEVHI